MSQFPNFLIAYTSICAVSIALYFAYKAIEHYGSNRDWWV